MNLLKTALVSVVTVALTASLGACNRREGDATRGTSTSTAPGTSTSTGMGSTSGTSDAASAAASGASR
jgi:hypothetical protein